MRVLRPHLPRPSGDALRLSTLYGSLFTVIGVQMPYWPVWLEHRGMTAVEIGMLLAAAYWTKVVTNPLIGALVDARGGRKQVMTALAAAALMAFALYVPADGFWTFMLIGAVGWSLFAGLMPLSETVTMSLTLRGRLDYGRIRLWGSLTFIAVAMAGGWVLEATTPEAVLWMVIGGLGLSLAAVAAVPTAPTVVRPGPKPPFSTLFRDRGFVLFLTAASLIQASHSVYYGFATLYWRDAGVSGGVIGGLWAVGVSAEVLLFAFSGAVVKRLGPARLLLTGAVAGILRWTVLGITTDPVVLVPIQVLHAATFGCTHIGAMHYIARAVAPGLAVRAQALYSSVAAGLAPGLALTAAGPLYGTLGGQAFFAAAGVAGAAALTAWTLRPRRLAENTAAAESDSAAGT